jgi:phage shock protein C
MNPQSQGLIRSITGPVILITVGVLFCVDRFAGISFGQTWPVLLIVIGLLRLLGGRRPNRLRDGAYYAPPYTAPYAPPPPPPPPAPGERR